jgi:hypothetical protein
MSENNIGESLKNTNPLLLTICATVALTAWEVPTAAAFTEKVTVMS